MKAAKLIFISLIIISLQGCYAGRADMQRISRVLDQDNPEEFKSVMYAFIHSAKDGNIEKMISITSPETIKSMGLANLKNHYQSDTIPALQKCSSISSGGKNYHISKLQSGTGSGWKFVKTCIYGESKDTAIQFVILREQGKLVLASVNLE